MSAAPYFSVYAFTNAFLLLTERLSGKQSRLTATIPIFKDVEADHTYDTSKMEAFLVPAGTAVEVYATTLHYAPCSTGVFFMASTSPAKSTLVMIRPYSLKAGSVTGNIFMIPSFG